MMEGYKVVTAEEMARAEKGGDPKKYMEAAGSEVANWAAHYIQTHGLPKRVTLLVGKGNNGGDAYAAGLCLLEKGYVVTAYALEGDTSALNREFRETFQKKQGKFSKNLEGLLIDGLLGTGFRGKLQAKMGAVIEQANASALPIIAIDIPSGLNGTTGEIDSEAIVANETITLGFAKIGLFLQKGWNYVGKLRLADFGLPQDVIATTEAVAYLPKRLELPKIIRTRHKYEAGYVVGYAGSKHFPGAAKLAGLAALKAGAGIVRIFHPEEIGSAPLELICNEWSAKGWSEALKKAKAVFVGPGLASSKDWLKKHLKSIQLNCVIDAEALLSDVPYPKSAILTPHRGEVLRLLGLEKSPRDEELFAKIIRFCEKKQLYVVLKGAPTFIFGPKHLPMIVPRGDPGMASAGAGDVLTGMIAAFLAQGCGPYEAALLGVTIHSIAGEKAAEEFTSYCMSATDMIRSMPRVFEDILKGLDIMHTR